MPMKNNDQQGRFRNRIVSFRMSEEESELLNKMVELSGLNKQYYLIKTVTDTAVDVHYSPYLAKQLITNLIICWKY